MPEEVSLSTRRRQSTLDAVRSNVVNRRLKTICANWGFARARDPTLSAPGYPNNIPQHTIHTILLSSTHLFISLALLLPPKVCSLWILISQCLFALHHFILSFFFYFFFSVFTVDYWERLYSHSVIPCAYCALGTRRSVKSDCHFQEFREYEIFFLSKQFNNFADSILSIIMIVTD